MIRKGVYYSRIELATKFAREKHDGQRYGVRPYFDHIQDVVDNLRVNPFWFQDDTILISALLHDVVEDCGVSLKEIKDRFGEDVAEIVGLLTHNRYEPYRDYIDGIRNNHRAVIIKICDILANLKRLKEIEDEEKRNRLERKYFRALAMLAGAE